MVCKSCGKEIPENAKFCRSCGSKIETIMAMPEAASPAKSMKVESPGANKGKSKRKKFVIGLVGSIAGLFIILTVFAAIGNSNGADDVITSAETLDNPLTEAEALKLLRSWLDDHSFDPPVNINEKLTDEDESGFTFVLYSNLI